MWIERVMAEVGERRVGWDIRVGIQDWIQVRWSGLLVGVCDGCGEGDVPMLRTTQIKLTCRTVVDRGVKKVLANSCRYDIGCVIPIPPAMRRTVP